MSEGTIQLSEPTVVRAFARDLQACEAAGCQILPPPGKSSVCRYIHTFPLRGRLFAWFLWKSWPSKWLGIRRFIARHTVSPYILVAATVVPPEKDEEESRDNLSRDGDDEQRHEGPDSPPRG